MADKIHKQTDRLLFNLEKQLKKEYSKKFFDLKHKIKEFMGELPVDKDLTPIERYTQAQKYNRIEKIEEEFAREINVVNKKAVSMVNTTMKEVYKTNYKGGINELAVLLAITIPNKYEKLPEQKEINKEIEEEISPFDTLALNDAKDIDLLRRDVIRQFTTSIMNGEDANKLIKRLQKTTELKLSDITRIARTETTRIENLGRLDAYEVAKKMGYTVYKKWVAVSDGKTRHTHKLADGQMVEIDEDFVVGGERLKCPGDKNGSAGNVINCRCTMIAGIKK